MSEDDKKRDRALQRRVRERKAKTGESYQAAWRQLADDDGEPPAEEPVASEPPDSEPPVKEPVASEPPKVALTAEQAAALLTTWHQLTGTTVLAAPQKTFERRERLILAFHLPQALPQQPTRVAARAKESAINVERIFISGAGTARGAGDWIVNDIEIDGRSQLTLKNLSGALFSSSGVAAAPKATTSFSFEGFDTVEHDHELTIIVTYVGSNPKGAPLFASAIGTSPPQRPTVVSIVSGTSLPIATKMTIGARVENVPFQLERLEIENGRDWIVNDLRINGRTQFKQSGDVPGDMFDATTITSFVALEECAAGSEIELDVTFVGAAKSALFKAKLEGTVIRDDLRVPPPDLRVIIRTGDAHFSEVVATCNWRTRPGVVGDLGPLLARFSDGDRSDG